ncbi:MAG TPA: PIN domain-containing protein [Terriglobia bacterium]|nr:PIN domain-containing protein [Terriglobia bacterium]
MLESARVDEILTVEEVVREVEEYAGLLARKKRLAEDVVLLAVAALPVSIIGLATYADAIPEAQRRIAQRDPDDVDLLGSRN